MSSQMDQTSMSTIEPDGRLPISGAVNSDPPPPPPPLSHHIVQQPLVAPQRQDVGPMQPGPLYSQVAFYRQGQNQPIVQHVLNVAATGGPAAPPQPYNNILAQLIQNLPLFGYLPDGQALYLLPAPTTLKTEPTTLKTEPTTVKTEPTTVETEKRKRVAHDGPYIKKPPNSFMLFMKEQRPIYAAEMKTIGCVALNVILGQKWKSLSTDEQAKYYEQAKVEKCRHAQCHPGWTPKNNYGVKRKRDRSNAAKLAAKLAEASTWGEVTRQDKKPCVASVSREVVEAPPTNRFVTEPSNLQIIPLLSPDTKDLATVNNNVETFSTVNDDVESFWLDFNELAEVKEFNLTVVVIHDKPVPPETEALVSPTESDEELQDDLLEWAKEVEGLLAGLEQKDPEIWSFSDICCFSFERHVKHITKKTPSFILNISRLRPSLSSSVTETFILAFIVTFITSRLDQCNSVLYGTSTKTSTNYNTSRTQLLSHTRTRDHMTPVLQNLHWLPIQHRIQIKVLLITTKPFTASPLIPL